MSRKSRSSRFFFFNDTATTEIYTLSLHDALPIFRIVRLWSPPPAVYDQAGGAVRVLTVPSHSRSGAQCQYQSGPRRDRKSTRLNSSHANISYAVFCLKKK